MSKVNSLNRVLIPAGHLSEEEVRAFMNGCLVPLLAREFWRARDEQAFPSPTAKQQKPTSGPLGKEDGR